MKKRIRAGALALAVLLALSLFSCSGCGGDGTPAVMEYEGLSLSEGVYRYWLSCYRAQFSHLEKEHGTDRLYEIADIGIRKSLIAAGLFDRMGLRLDDLARDQINRAMEQLVADAGGRAEFDAAAAAYGTNYDAIRTAISYEQKGTALYQYLFGEGGVYEIGEEQLEAYYQEHYRRVHVLTVLYVTYETDDDGERIFDETTQSYRYIKKTGEALKKQEEKADAVRAELAYSLTAAKFENLMKTYNEDTVKEGTYPNGYYFSDEGDYSTYIEEIPAAAVLLSPGETAEVTSEYGVHFIYALENDKGAYADEKNADFFDGFDGRVRMAFYEDFIEEHLVAVKVFREEKDKIGYTDYPPNYEIYW